MRARARNGRIRGWERSRLLDDSFKHGRHSKRAPTAGSERRVRQEKPGGEFGSAGRGAIKEGPGLTAGGSTVDERVSPLTIWRDGLLMLRQIGTFSARACRRRAAMAKGGARDSCCANPLSSHRFVLGRLDVGQVRAQLCQRRSLEVQVRHGGRDGERAAYLEHGRRPAVGFSMTLLLLLLLLGPAHAVRQPPESLQ